MFRITYLGEKPVFINGKQLNKADYDDKGKKKNDNDSIVVLKLDRVYKNNPLFSWEEISIDDIKDEVEKKKSEGKPKPKLKGSQKFPDRKPTASLPSEAEQAAEIKKILTEAKKSKIKVTSLDDAEIAELLDEEEKSEKEDKEEITAEDVGKIDDILERDIPDSDEFKGE